MCQKHTSIKVERHWELFPPQRRCQMYKRSSSRYKQMSIFLLFGFLHQRNLAAALIFHSGVKAIFQTAQAAPLGVH